MQNAKDAEQRATAKAQAAVEAIRQAQDAAVNALDADLRAKAHHQDADAIIAEADSLRDKYTYEIIRMPFLVKDKMKRHQAASLALPFLERGMVLTGGSLQPDPWPLSAWDVTGTREVRPCISCWIASQCHHRHRPPSCA